MGYVVFVYQLTVNLFSDLASSNPRNICGTSTTKLICVFLLLLGDGLYCPCPLKAMIV